MAKLLIATRMFENVAVDAWGNSLTGASAEWVSKGIFEYVVNDFTRISELEDEVLEALKRKIELNDSFFREFIIDLQVIPDQFNWSSRCTEIFLN
jgi:hypothetical protein